MSSEYKQVMYKHSSLAIESRNNLSFVDQRQDITQNVENLLMRILMLQLQVDRKDLVIQTLNERNQKDIQLVEYSSRCNRYEVQVRTLTETIHLLRDQLSSKQRNKNMELHRSRMECQGQLDEKVLSLESKIRKMTDEQFDSEEIIKKLKVDLSMANFNLMKTQSGDKSKIRDLEMQLQQQRAKQQQMRQSLTENARIIDNMKTKIIEYEEREKGISRSYEERIRNIQSEMVLKDNLKRSQLSSTEEKVVMTSQQIARLSEQNKMLKRTIDALRVNQQKITIQIQQKFSQYRQLEISYSRLQTNLKEMCVELQSKCKDIQFKEKELSNKESQIIQIQSQNRQLYRVIQQKSMDGGKFIEQNLVLNTKMSELHAQIDRLKSEMRKMKRQSTSSSVICQSCRLRQDPSSKVLPSERSSTNFSEIIEAAEQLQRSSLRIDHLLNTHSTIMESSLSLRRGQINMF